MRLPLLFWLSEGEERNVQTHRSVDSAGNLDQRTDARGLGSTTDLADGSGNVTASYGYDVFGEVRTGTPPYYDDAFLFTGEQRDWETGLYYLRARYYDLAPSAH